MTAVFVCSQASPGHVRVNHLRHDNVLIEHNGIQVGNSAVATLASAHQVQVDAYVRCVASDTIGLNAFSTVSNTLATGSGVTFVQAMWERE